jgi:hypothetical protein
MCQEADVRILRLRPTVRKERDVDVFGITGNSDTQTANAIA